METTPNDASEFRSEGDLNISSHRSAWSGAQLDPATQQLLADDARYFFRQSLSTPCLDILTGAEGSYIEDIRGNRMLDFHGNEVHQVGFANPDVIAAIKAQLDALSFCTRRYTNVPAIELAKKLAEMAPGGPSKVLLSPGGTSAIGIALKLARTATGRFKTISMWDSFHGASLDAISVGGEAIFRKGIGPLLPGTEHVPPSDPYRCVWGCDGQCNLKCADYIEYVLEKERDIGAVISETIRNVPYLPHKEYWTQIREACDRYGALLVLDEIPTCLGRTGEMFACQHYGVVPDILVLGKGLGGGIFPLAAVVAKAELDTTPEQALGHYTHEKNPVACAAALATIESIEGHGLVQRSRDLGWFALKRMEALKDEHELVGDVRGIGLLLGIELVKDRETRERAADEAEQVMYSALAKGLNFKVSMGNVLSLYPPLTTTEAELDTAFSIIGECLAEVSG